MTGRTQSLPWAQEIQQVITQHVGFYAESPKKKKKKKKELLFIGPRQYKLRNQPPASLLYRWEN